MALDPEMAARMAPGFEPVPLAKTLLRTARFGMLATIDPGGAPFASLTSVATDVDGAPLILISQLAHHTRHLAADVRCSLLLGQPGKGDPLAHPRLTLTGSARAIDRDTNEGERIRRRFLGRHPKAELYADFPDFAFWRIELAHVYLNGGFARAWDGPASEILVPFAACTEMAAIAESAVAHMNEGHREAISLYATRLGGAEAAPWTISGIDPEGLDMIAGDRTARVLFAERLERGFDLRSVLVDLARQARAAGS